MDIDQIIRLIQKNLQSNPPEASTSFDTAAGNAEPPPNSPRTDAARRYGGYGPTLSTRDALPPGYVRNSRGQIVKAEDINKVFTEGFGGLIAEQLKRGGEILGTGPKAQAAREVVSQSENIVPKPRPSGTEDFGLPRNFNNPFSFPVNNAAELGAELGLGDDSVATRPLPPMVSEFTRQGADAQQGADELGDDVMLAQLASPTTASGKKKDPGKFASDMATYSAAKGLAGGTDYAEYNNQKNLLDSASESISGLLGDVDWRGILRVLARPEFVAPMGPGQSPVTNFINAAAADRTAQAATAAALQKSKLEAFKAETDRLKAQKIDGIKPSSEITKLYTRTGALKEALGYINEIKTNIPSVTTGFPGDTLQILRGIGAQFNLDMETSATENVAQLAAAIKAKIIATGVFGKEVNRQEHKLLDALVPTKDVFDTTTRTKLLKAYNRLQQKFTAEANQLSAVMTNVYGLPSYGSTVPNTPFIQSVNRGGG